MTNAHPAEVKASALDQHSHARTPLEVRATNFSYPDPESVKGRVLADLLAGDSLTHMDVWERHGSSRAAHHVLMLRKAGFPVETLEIEAPTSDGRRARIARYSLPTEAIAAAGERGRQFVAAASVGGAK